MRAPIRIAVAQPRCVSRDVAANARSHAEAIVAANSRVVVFPELSLTGYELDADPISVADPRLLPIAKACAETRSVALVGAPVEGGSGERYIAMLAVDGDGARVAYRKVNLGAAEACRFVPGVNPEVIEVDGWRLGLGICKDTGVRQHATDVTALGIDAYVAGLVMNEDEIDEHDKRAYRIATSHAVLVAFASFAGATGGGYERAAGCSSIWSSAGEVIARAGPEVGGLACAKLG